MKNILRPLTYFTVALQFLTVAPPVIRRTFTAEELGKSTGYFPLVGAVVGVVLLAGSLLLGAFFPPLVRAALALALWVGLSGALHLDGFLDSCDGLLGGFTPESRLEIMRDERVGAFALAGGLLLFLVKFSSLSALPAVSPALLVAPVLGRWGMALAIAAFPYARPEGLGRAMKSYAEARQGKFFSPAVLASLLAVALTLAICAAFTPGVHSTPGVLSAVWVGPFALGLAGLTTWAVARFALGRIPGLTGDLYGAINELVEMVVLLLFVLVRAL